MSPFAWLMVIFADVGIVIALTYKKYYYKPMQPDPTFSPAAVPKNQAVYDAARSLMGKKIYDLLDPSVPATEGCASSVSYVLQQAGFKVPPKGLATVLELVAWMEAQGFKKIDTYVPGCVIVAHNSDSAITTYAHAGIVMFYGICSNTSFPIPGFESGEWAENYKSVALWESAFLSGGSETSFYMPVENQVAPAQPSGTVTS